MEELTHQIALAQHLVSRLERLSADSFWAHQASGLRGSLLRLLAVLEDRENRDPDELQADAERLAILVRIGFEILEKAAREIETPDTRAS